jgi:choline dehydrogenase-like flavoprotein
VVIVGAGAAGIATAIAASRKGLRVTVLDSRKPPIDKPCGEGLLPGAVVTLRRIGIELDSRVASPFSGIRFCDANSSATARIASGQAFGLRRNTLSPTLCGRSVDGCGRGSLGPPLPDLCHRRATATAVRMTRLLLLMERSAWIRGKTLRLFASQPALFSKMMSIHTGESFDQIAARPRNRRSGLARVVRLTHGSPATAEIVR